MNSIYSRNFFVTAGLVLLSFVILASAMLGFARGFFINERREALDNSAEEAARSSVSSFAENHVLAGWDLRMSITTISRSTDFHIFITDYNGNVVSCSTCSSSASISGGTSPTTSSRRSRTPAHTTPSPRWTAFTTRAISSPPRPSSGTAATPACCWAMPSRPPTPRISQAPGQTCR